MIHQTKTIKYRLQSGMFPKFIHCCIDGAVSAILSMHNIAAGNGAFGSCQEQCIGVDEEYSVEDP